MKLRRFRLGPIDVLLTTPGRPEAGTSPINEALPETQEQAGHADPALPDVHNGTAATLAGDAKALQDRVNAIEWYHTIDLGNGVVTPGWFDLRHLLHHYPIPASLEGKRVLDVASFDGFWAFEFERRGAAEVVALDIDTFNDLDMCPRIRRTKSPAFLSRKTGEGFRLAHEAMGSKVHREVCNIYDISPERLGMFDFVFISDVLLHLRSPMKAIDNVASVTRGTAAIVDVYDDRLPGRLMEYEGGVVHNTWWSIGYGALEQMVRDAGFREVKCYGKFLTGYRGHKPILWHAAFECKP
jgi:tRNA (mo5U34)-methyltransferase